jgi:hypothetical protein
VNSTVSSLMATMAGDLGAGGAFAGGAGGASVSDMRSGAARRMDPRGDGAKAEAEPTTRAETRSFPYFTMFFLALGFGGGAMEGGGWSTQRPMN